MTMRSDGTHGKGEEKTATGSFSPPPSRKGPPVSVRGGVKRRMTFQASFVVRGRFAVEPCKFLRPFP